MKVSGKIEIEGRETEFLLTDDGSYMQSGTGDQSVLGERVDLVEALGEAYLVWREENVCRPCGDRLLDDGEGYDGECGDCADRNPANREDDDDDDGEDGDGPEEA